MTKPDRTFTITVNPVSRVIGCSKKQAEEARGMIGWHQFTTCPDCQVIPEGYEFWGENGHKQGECPNDRMALANRLRRLARKQWRMTTGGIMGYRFALGGRMFYRG